MNAQDRFRRADALFRAVRALPLESRDAFLAEQCAGETTLLQQVRALLRADERADGALDHPALAPVDIAAAPQAAEPAPEWVGRHRIIRRIGAGGMGAVYEAEQDNPRRRVAVKLMEFGIGSRRMLQRFQQEAQILGRLQHPGIAQILEAGTFDGPCGPRPFIVMELVQGPSLLDYARAECLDARRRLELLALVCDAVQAAHQCGVVHRDLKPQNILIVEGTRSGAEAAASVAQPKILDFGVARLTDADVQAVTQHTTVGELIGTVPYMSPEQAAGDPARLDWRSDVYSLGVVLYELLTGRLPHDVRRLMVHEAVRVIREEDPAPAGSIDRAFRGDVETIIARALEKEPARRYQSAAELAADIRRHLCEQPIAARPASALYRAAKFARRNRAIVAGTAVAFVALAAGTAVAVRQAVVAERARAESERQTYRACLAAASAALRHHDSADARRNLDAAPAALRGWEWEHLSGRTDDSLLRLRTGFVPMRLALSPDGSLMAACASSGSVQLWRVPQLERIAAFDVYREVRDRRIYGLMFQPDGRTLRVDTRAGTLTLATPTLRLIAGDRAGAALRSPDGRWSLGPAAAGGGAAIALRTAQDRRVITRIEDADAYGTPACFSADGRLAALGLADHRGLLLLRTVDGAPVARRPDLARVAALAFSPDGSRLAVGGADGACLLLDAADGVTRVALSGNESSVHAVAFSPDAQRVATAAGDRTVRLWRAADGALLSTMHGNQGGVTALAFAADGAAVVTGCADGTVRWWDGRAESDPFVLRAPATVYGLSFAPDGGTLAAACLGGERPLRVWSIDTGREVLAALDGYASALAFSPDGQRIAVGRAHGDTDVVAANDGRLLAQLAGQHWRTNWLAFGAADDRLLTIGNDGWLLERVLPAGERTRTLQFPAPSEGEGCRAAFSPDGALLAVAGRNRLAVLDAADWSVRFELSGHTTNIYALAFSPDGARLVSGARDRTLRVWDLRRRECVAVLSGHSDEIFAVIYNPDGRRIVSGGRDRVIRVWDAERLEELTQLHGHTSFVYCLAFGPDGRMLASGGGDGVVRIWDTRPYREQQLRTRSESG